MARAGFFFTGLADEVKCFYCDGGLKNWEPNDEPWSEHAKWFPRCEWLIQQRGQTFIAHVQTVNPPPFGAPPLEFSSPLRGRDEPFFQPPPHTFQKSYQQVPHQHGASNTVEEPKKKKDMTIEEEKVAALQEYEKKLAEPEAGVEVNTKKKPGASALRTPPKLKPVDTNMKKQSSIDDILGSPTTKMVIEMGFDETLVRYVAEEHLRRTGREFSSPEELLEGVWAAEEEGVDPSSLTTGSLPKAVGGHDSDDEEYYAGKPAKKLAFEEETGASNIVDIQARKLAGLSLNDDPEDDELVKALSKTPGLNEPPRSSPLSPQPLTSNNSLQSLQDKQLCIICLDNEKNTVFLPCKHLSTCEACASRVTECPLCRQPILTSFKVFMP